MKPLILTLAASLISLSAAHAACDLKVTNAYTVKSNGTAYNPKYGETYYLKVVWEVTGTPKTSYSILFQVAGQKYKWTGVSTGAGAGYSGIASFNLELDGEIPFSVTLDPDHLSGDTKTANNVFKGTFTPTPPATALEYFNPVVHTGSETCTVPWNLGGSVTDGYTIMGKPVTDSFQVVKSATGPTFSSAVITTPTGDPIWQTPRINYTPAVDNQHWIDTTNFKVSVSSVRTRISNLKAVTWAKEAQVPAKILPYLQPNDLVQSTDPAIAAYVKTVLPANYKTTLTPYDAAKKLYMAIVKRTVYETPAIQDALTTLSLKKGDCGSDTNLCSACFRSIGIPSRSNSGFWVGTDQWHVNGEFYLQGIGWIPFDPSESRTFDPSGKYPYFFGSDASLNQFVAVSRGEDHRVDGDHTTTAQVGWLVFSGNAANGTYGTTSTLK
ncbi:MAG: transglutaminase-like domain-containing protein [Luteolibacter sp.]|uniref:transglutaminase-like domain-containing protein n=1 Tax=Luteolibacter sp. TaxID=1962973 RepID=UPI0032648835